MQKCTCKVNRYLNCDSNPKVMMLIFKSYIYVCLTVHMLTLFAIWCCIPHYC